MKTADKTGLRLSRLLKTVRAVQGKTILFWCILFFISSIFWASLVFPTTGALAPERVLLISSYHPGFPTFFKQIKGIKSVFATNDILLDVEFMDTKRFAGEENQRLFHQHLAYKIAHTKP